MESWERMWRWAYLEEVFLLTSEESCHESVAAGMPLTSGV